MEEGKGELGRREKNVGNLEGLVFGLGEKTE